MRKSSLVVLLSLLFLSSSALFSSSIEIAQGVWNVSKNMTGNPSIGGKLREIEIIARQDKAKAAEMCAKLKDSLEDSEIYMDDEEYLPLVLDSMGLYYAVYKDSGDKKALSEAQRLLDAYAKKAEGKEYSAYKYLFHRIRAYYFNRKEYKKMINTQKDMILYDPSDYGQILTLMDYIRDYPDEIGDLDKFVKEFKDKGGVIDPEFDLTLLLASKKKNREKIEGSCAWLEKQSGSSPEILMRALPRITKFISIKDKEALIEYYYALTDLALRQSSTEDRLTVFAAALNERQKLVTAAPEVLPPKEKDEVIR